MFAQNYHCYPGVEEPDFSYLEKGKVKDRSKSFGDLTCSVAVGGKLWELGNDYCCWEGSHLSPLPSSDVSLSQRWGYTERNPFFGVWYEKESNSVSTVLLPQQSVPKATVSFTWAQRERDWNVRVNGLNIIMKEFRWLWKCCIKKLWKCCITKLWPPKAHPSLNMPSAWNFGLWVKPGNLISDKPKGTWYQIKITLLFNYLMSRK